MKIKIKLNDGEVTEYPSIKEARKMLNEADYYCDEIYLGKKTNLSYLYKQSCIYGDGWLTAYQIYNID
jgi:hypothetical protein